MAKRFQPPEYGVEIYEGLPGSGKSFALVRRVVSIILEQKRPVYTNLPIVFPVMRRYLKIRGGERCANLLYDLSEEHFKRFLQRQRLRAEFMNARKSFRRDLSPSRRADDLEELFEAEHGAPVLLQRYDEHGQPVGDPPNWIEGGAVLVLDEVHHWFPQRAQKDEGADLEAYVTMHRHHWHLILLATQARMQVSITFRRNCSKIWLVRDKGEDQLAWGLRFKHLGLRAIGYAAFTGDQVEARSLDNVLPVANHVVLPSLPWHQVYFRLYRSFTHVASPRKLRRDLARARVKAGLVEVSRRPAEAEPKGGIVKRATHAAGRWVIGLVGRWTRRAVLVGCGAGVALLVMWARAEEPAAVAGAEGVNSAKEPELVWPAWKSLGDGWIRTDGGRARVGERLGNGAQVLAVSRDPRVCVLDARGLLYVWRWGEAAPRRLGTRSEVGAAIHAANVRRLNGGRGEQAEPGAGGREVEPAEGDAVGGGGVGGGGAG